MGNVESGKGLMISKFEKDRIRKIIDALSQAAEGDYSTRLDFASEDDVLGPVADAVNTLLEKAGTKISSMSQPVEDLSQDAGRYKRIIDSLEESYFEVDFKGHLLFFNGTAMRDLGYTRKELLGLHFHHLADKANAQKIYEAFHSVFVTGRPIKGFDLEILKKNGEKLDLESSVALLLDDGGKPVGFRGVMRDISKRKQAERALRESEGKYRNILENMDDIYLETDLKGNYIFFNDSLCRVLGYSREELQNINYRLIGPPERVQYIYKALNEIYVTGREKNFAEYKLIARDGSTIYLDMSVSLLRSSTGEPVGFKAFGRDITEKVKARRKIEESERRLRLITDNIADVIWTMDFNMHFTYISPSIIRVAGFTPEEVINTPVKAIVPPDHYEQFKQLLADELAREEKRPFSTESGVTIYEIPFLHKDGSPRWAEINVAFNRDENGRAFEIVGVARDVTKRKRAEEALQESEKLYRMIVENVNDIVWTVGLDLHFTYVSPAHVRLTGFTTEEIVSMTLPDLVTAESFELAAKTLAEELALETSGQPFNPNRYRILELEVLRKDGSHVWVEITAIFNRDPDGRPTEIIAVGRDITERKKVAEERDKLEKQLAQAQKMETIGRLAGGVAHDFNNMLSVILGYVDLAKLHVAPKHFILKDIAEIEKAAIRSRDITRQLLAFSRQQIIEPKVIDINEMIARVQKALIRLIGEDIELEVIRGENLGMVKFDPSQMEQILINLAVNARDAMPDGGKLMMETENVALDDCYCDNHAGFTPGRYVRLSVSDNGVGMDQETLQHIYEPFFTTKETGKGTGLGLATIYGIVQQNNSFINVYSEPGHGTTFNIYIPHTTEERDVKEKSEREPAAQGTGNVLLVEDDPMVLEITKRMLESLGYVVVVAKNALDAASLCEESSCESIDLVITDVVMPSMSGKELRNRLTEIRPGIKVLFISGYTADAIARHGILDEGVHFLQKPFNLKDLARKVKEILGED